MSAPHNKQRYGETWDQQPINRLLAQGIDPEGYPDLVAIPV